MYYRGLEEKIIKDCLMAGEKENILICGNDFACDLIEGLQKEIKKVNAIDIVVNWSDKIIVNLMKNLGPSSAASRVMPVFKDFFQFLHMEKKADKIIIILPPVDNYINFLSVSSSLQLFERIYLANLLQLQLSGVPGIILDYPFDTNTRRMFSKEAFDSLISVYRNSIDMDFYVIKALNNKLMPLLKHGKEVSISSDYGTELTFMIEGRTPCEEEGRLGFQTSFCQVPGGEVFISPVEETVNGIYVIDINSYGFNFGLKFKDGILVDSVSSKEYEKDARKIIMDMGIFGEKAGEFGIGTNPASIPLLTGTISEKALGTLHIAIGENRPYGGNHASPIHYDFVSTCNNVFIDGQKIIESGKIIV
jgi:leucyl aminopeptidase (aminopeptidase T)